MFSQLLLFALLLCSLACGAPRGAEPTPSNPSLVVPVVEITPAPTMPPVVAELLRRSSNPAIVPRDDSDLMKRQACGAFYVTCDTGSCCYIGQECFRNSAGVDSCRYPEMFDYSSLLSSLTAIYGGYSYSNDAELYSSIYASYLNLFTSLPGGRPTGGSNPPASTAKTGSSSSNSGSGSSSSWGDTTTSTSKKKSNTGMIVGIAVGSAVGVAIIATIIWYFWRKRKPTPTPYPAGMAQTGTTPFQQHPGSQPAYAGQAAQVDIKPAQVYQFQQQPLATEIGGTGIAPQQAPSGNASYAVQGAGYQGPISPPPTHPSAQEMSGDTQFLPHQQHPQHPQHPQQLQYGPPRNGTLGPPAEMDAGQGR
ncbi:unnamed protein product [Tuber aestivum]|uniref:Mid2 domain-containing protein n=1 Tax=Tuber aestivum TaxID=59557 RepID=A0A292PIF0_9PEZI|nr:unnamed protein product [Tuber aestivum]